MRWRQIQRCIAWACTTALMVWPLIVVLNVILQFNRRFAEDKTTIEVGLALISAACLVNGMWLVFIGLVVGMILGNILGNPINHDSGSEMAKIAIGGSLGTIVGWFLHENVRIPWRRSPPTPPSA